MFIYKDTYKSIEDFTWSLLNGDYDQSIYNYLNELSKNMDSWRFKALDPTAYFEFSITLSNDDKPLIINSWALTQCYRWHSGSSALEHKLILLVASIIRSQHAEMSAILKFNKDAERYRQTQLINTKEA